MGEGAAPRFGLLRYFTGASLAVVLVGALGTGAASAWLMRGILVRVECDEADNLVEYFVTEFAQDGYTLDRWGVEPVPEDARRRALADMANFRVVELNLHASDGRMLEALQAPGIPPDPRWDEGLSRALGGRVALRWETDVFGTNAPPGAVETYVPVREGDRVVAAARVRRDLSPVMVRALRVVPGLVAGAGVVGLAVFGALWLLVRRADRLIARQHAEIEQGRAALEERNRLLEEIRRKKDDFYAMCSHDLRSPLLSVHAATQLVLGDATHPLALPQRRFLEDNQRAVAGLLELVDNLLDLARADAPSQTLEAESVDVTDVMRGVVATHRVLPANRDVTIEELYPDRDARVLADRRKLARVFHNLLSNALEHGGGRPVTVTVNRLAAGVRVVVRDRGVGIPPDLQERIFERYAKGGRRGLGLGLAIVKDFVEAHGGTVTAASVPGEGATLTVEIPEAPSAASSPLS